jgi:spermidine synthase
LTDTYRLFANLFARRGCYLAAVPTYVCGFMALSWASADDIEKPAATVARRFKAAGLRDLRYYNPAIHAAAFALPSFVQALLR